MNLVKNGSFEQVLPDSMLGDVNGNKYGDMPTGSGGGTWDVWKELPHWKTLPNTNGVEVQTKKTLSNVDPHHGEYYLEMDSHPHQGSHSGIMQTIDVDSGKYLISYYYMPRTNTPNDNILEVYWDGQKLASQNAIISQHKDWLKYTHMVHVGTSGAYELKLQTNPLPRGNTLGALLDNVGLFETPEPSTLALIGAGLAGISWRRRQRA